MKKNFHLQKGFTLIEIMVSVSIFITVMVIIVGSIVSVFDANKKSQSLQAVMDNLNFTLESLTRNIRFGTNYHCDATVGDIAVPRDCSSGASSIAVKGSDNVVTIYSLSNGRIARSRDGGATYYNLTGSDVTITKLSFYVIGAPPFSNGDVLQPRVIIVVGGYAGNKETSRSTFTLQTTVSQRMFDSQ